MCAGERGPSGSGPFVSPNNVHKLMSLSGQEGIDRLLKAETEATEIVSKARKGENRNIFSEVSIIRSQLISRQQPPAA
jgi:hypothetical protein